MYRERCAPSQVEEYREPAPHGFEFRALHCFHYPGYSIIQNTNFNMRQKCGPGGGRRRQCNPAGSLPLTAGLTRLRSPLRAAVPSVGAVPRAPVCKGLTGLGVVAVGRDGNGGRVSTRAPATAEHRCTALKHTLLPQRHKQNGRDETQPAQLQTAWPRFARTCVISGFAYRL